MGQNYSLLILLFVILSATAYLIRAYFIFVTKVSSCSMLPLLNPEDKILTRRIYHGSEIKRGDIIVFYSQELDKTLIKRAIGLPGDQVEIKSDGTVWIGGMPLAEPYLAYRAGKGGSFKVPKGRYFLIGDNRPKSNDSRHWARAYIPEKHILGKAIFRLKPFGPLGGLKRA